MAHPGMNYGYGLGTSQSYQRPAAQWWEILQVSPDASEEIVDAAYRALSKSAHPDMGGSEDDMKRLNVAHDRAKAKFRKN